MIKEQVPQLTLEMLKPDGRSASSDESYRARIRLEYGDAGQEFSESLLNGKPAGDLISEYRERIGTHFFNFLAHTFGIPVSETRVVYRDSRSVALGVVEGALKRILPRASNLFKDEVTTNSDEPIDFFYDLARAQNGQVTPRLEYDLRRHFILFNTDIELIAKSGNGQIGRDLADYQRLFDTRLYYRGLEGHDEEYSVYAYHDKETNRFLRLAGKWPRVPRGSERLLFHAYTARRIEGIGLVNTNIRQKNLEAATEKTLAKAHDPKNRGVINVDEVEDLAGFRWVALEEDMRRSGRSKKQREFVRDRVNSEIQASNRGVIIKPEDSVDSGRGQSKIVFGRDKIFSEGSTVPIENIFFAFGDFLDQEYEVGTKDPETEIYNGRSHRLFDLRRIKPILPYLFTYSIHRINTEAALLRRMEEVVEEIRYEAELTLIDDPRNALEHIRNGGR